MALKKKIAGRYTLKNKYKCFNSKTEKKNKYT